MGANIIFVKKSYVLLIVCFLTATSSHAYADGSPVGLWKTIDDSTGKARSLIRISDKNGELIATIEKGLLSTDTPNDVCDQCTGERKDKPLIGMVIMDGMKAKGDVFEGGGANQPPYWQSNAY